MTGRGSARHLVFVGSLNREAPNFQGARGGGLGAYTFDEQSLRIEKQAETADIHNPGLPVGHA